MRKTVPSVLKTVFKTSGTVFLIRTWQPVNNIYLLMHLSMLSPRGGGAYMGDLIDLCLPALGNLILIFVPRVGIFEFSDQE
jgi:hypothetical protein